MRYSRILLQHTINRQIKRVGKIDEEIAHAVAALATFPLGSAELAFAQHAMTPLHKGLPFPFHVPQLNGRLRVGLSAVCQTGLGVEEDIRPLRESTDA